MTAMVYDLVLGVWDDTVEEGPYGVIKFENTSEYSDHPDINWVFNNSSFSVLYSIDNQPMYDNPTLDEDEIFKIYESGNLGFEVISRDAHELDGRYD